MDDEDKDDNVDIPPPASSQDLPTAKNPLDDVSLPDTLSGVTGTGAGVFLLLVCIADVEIAATCLCRRLAKSASA